MIVAVVVVVALLVVGLVTWVVTRQRRESRERERQLPIPIVAFPGIAAAPEVARPAIQRNRSGRPTPSAGSAAPAYVPPPREGGRRVEFTVPPGSTDPRFSPQPGYTSAPGFEAPRAVAPPPLADDAPTAFEGESVRFHRVSDLTLQFLPGRLEIIGGGDQGHEIRFVKTTGQLPEITFGRNEGPPYRHVQLRQQTVSRNHARMSLENGTWKLTNLSTTNPVVVNGRELTGDESTVVLSEGDRIEMGEVAFRFRER